jgi:hypothetical protein
MAAPGSHLTSACGRGGANLRSVGWYGELMGILLVKFPAKWQCEGMSQAALSAVPTCRSSWRVFVLGLYTISILVAAGEDVGSEDLGFEFGVQGEYVGEFDGKRWGVQVIARGGGEFEAVASEGGLPGDGWDGSGGGAEGRERAASVAGDGGRDGAVRFGGLGDWEAIEISEGEIRVFERGGGERGGLSRVERVSPTLGKEAPEGAIILFDGSGVGAWEGEMSESGHLRQGAVSRDLFGDFELHLEFLLPFEPEKRGQGRGNSGLYLQGRYEVQILDSFGLRGEKNECGGIYSVAAPLVNMCFPPLRWQTYDVKFSSARWEGDKKVSDARVSVWHNGVLIHDDQEVPHATAAARLGEGPARGPIYLQDHGSEVRFRNIWLKPAGD